MIENIPESSVTIGEHAVMWNMSIFTGIRVLHNWADIAVYITIKSTCISIDVAIPQDKNIVRNTTEKLRKWVIPDGHI